MIVVMKPDATKEQIQAMIKKIEDKGLKTILLEGTNRNVIAAIGDKREIPPEFWDRQPTVERTVPILAPYKMASRELRPETTTVPIDGQVLGGRKVGIIAGPCTVESREQVLEIAHAVKEAGALALRGGAFKPRTSPYSFQGLMEEGLEILALAGEETGLPIVSEVLTAEHVPLVSKYVDVLQVGTRNMTNFLLLKAVGESDKPVLLKRGMSAQLEEFLLAAEYVLSQGNPNVILCERGIRTFETNTRFTLSLTVVPQLKELSHLPVLVDPSHATGKRSLVPPMAKAAIAAGADGVILEVHPKPEEAWVDGPQTLSLKEFEKLMADLRRLAPAVDREI
ncbi:MAG: 3-deoxy-7-phosphoheptulonate synthase [Planctomycetes bacterium]|nr:3-deoxy-7-phosphoheptulonate synthase [Planctomycetota bacterium]